MRSISIGIIGAGRLGGCLAAGLHQAGLEVKYVSSLDIGRAEFIAGMTGAKVMKEPYRELRQVDVIFITTPDKAICMTARDLGRTIKSWEGKYVLHCSGILSCGELEDLKKRGAKVLSFHPLQTFPEVIDPGRFRDIYIAIEGDDVGFGMALAGKLGGKGFAISAEMKPLYHAAACLASGHLCGLIYTAVKCMREAGITEGDAQMLLPLIRGTIESIEKYGIEEALTGPIARGDAGTMQRHLKAIKDNIEIEEVYKNLSMVLIEISRADGNIKKEMENLVKNGIGRRD